MNTYEIELDFPWDFHLGEFLQYVENSGGSMKSFTARGSAGGNPCVTLTFKTKKSLQSYIREYSIQNQ